MCPLIDRAEQEQGREIIRKAMGLQEFEIDETEAAQGEEEIRQLQSEAVKLPGQRQEKIRCRKCGKDRIVLNQQNTGRECKEIGRNCAELPDIGIRGERIHREHKNITYADKEKLSEHKESWRRELVRCIDGNVPKTARNIPKEQRGA